MYLVFLLVIPLPGSTYANLEPLPAPSFFFFFLPLWVCCVNALLSAWPSRFPPLVSSPKRPPPPKHVGNRSVLVFTDQNALFFLRWCPRRALFLFCFCCRLDAPPIAGFFFPSVLTSPGLTPPPLAFIFFSFISKDLPCRALEFPKVWPLGV